MACVDCYCGRKEMEEKGVVATNTLCGPDLEALLKAYEDGDLSREEFLRLANG